MRYELTRLGSDNFENLIQSLIKGLENSAIMFGDGPDGQREVVVTNADFDVLSGKHAYGLTVGQAKYKSPNGKEKDWDWLRTNLKTELEGFREKKKTHPHNVPDTYLFFTNIVLTPKLDTGVRDRTEEFLNNYRDLIPNILVFGADDIRAMLENNRDVARCYTSFIMPGDVLEDLQNYLQALKNEKFEDLIEYTRQMFQEDSAVRLEQAGSVADRTINIRNVYTDLEAKTLDMPRREIKRIANHILELGDKIHKRGLTSVMSGNTDVGKCPNEPLPCNVVLLANAGQGKSTICQYICQIYRACLLKRMGSRGVERDAYIDGIESQDTPIPNCERFPFFVSLKQYAAWLNRQGAENSRSVVSYLVGQINGKARSSLTINDLRRFLSGYSWVFFFDGLDEVPASSNRGEVLRQIQLFLEGDLTEAVCDCMVICTSRPQGYDNAFSPSYYRHYELQNMSKSLCEKYIDRLLVHLERNGDERERFRSILLKALNDSVISKLMTTPLYTAIIVLLVKSGGTPPKKRYTLFQKYCDIVINREQQKEILPSLNDEYDWIKELHAQIGFLLQMESENADNAAAELSAIRCKELISNYIQAEEYEGNVENQADALYRAITERLSFLSLVSGAEQEECVIFPLRSIQEYFAAEWIISFNDDDKMISALELISVSAYWRNVFLFVSGYYAKEKKYKTIKYSIHGICVGNNGGEYDGTDDAVARRITMQGSRLALDVLCDNSFSRPRDQSRYFELVEILLKSEDDFELVERFLQLPDYCACHLLNSCIIPEIQNNMSTSGSAFRILWGMAQKGNDKASANLEEVICNIVFDGPQTIEQLLWLGYKRATQTAVRALFQRITEDFFEYFCNPFSAREEYWSFISYCLNNIDGIELTQTVLRQAVYRLIGSYRYDHNFFRISPISLPISFLQNMMQDSEFTGYRGSHTITNERFEYYPMLYRDGKISLAKYTKDFQTYQLYELVTLIEFFDRPSYDSLLKLVEVYSILTDTEKMVFCSVLMKWNNRLLHRIAENLKKYNNIEKLLEHYDRFTFEEDLKIEKELVVLSKDPNPLKITQLNSWEFFYNYYHADSVSQELLDQILCTAREDSISSGFLSFIFSVIRGVDELSDAQIKWGLNNLLKLLQNRWGLEIAKRVLDEASLPTLVSNLTQFPCTACIPSVFRYSDDISERVLRKMISLAKFGHDYLEVFAFVPFFGSMHSNMTLGLDSEEVSRYYEEIRKAGNKVALAGVIICLLSNEPLHEQEQQIREDLNSLFQEKSLEIIWSIYTRLFSFKGKMLAWDVANKLKPEIKQRVWIMKVLSRTILDDLEAMRVDHKELMQLSLEAHEY